MSHVKIKRASTGKIEVRLGPGLVSDTLAYGEITDEQALELAERIHELIEQEEQ